MTETTTIKVDEVPYPIDVYRAERKKHVDFNLMTIYQFSPYRFFLLNTKTHYSFSTIFSGHKGALTIFLELEGSTKKNSKMAFDSINRDYGKMDEVPLDYFLNVCKYVENLEDEEEEGEELSFRQVL